MSDKRDQRSALVLVEPVFAPGEVLWHGMAFAGGRNVNDVTGSERSAVLEHCWSALEGAGINTEFVVPEAEA